MGVRGFSGAIGLSTVLALAASCTEGNPRSDIPAPDLDSVLVFFPAGGLAHGRGLAGTFPSSVQWVSVRSHPTEGFSTTPVEADGSFQFTVIAISGDLLEIAGSEDSKGKSRGEPLYVQVPATPLPVDDYVCCLPTGTCQTKEDNDAQHACPDPLTGATQCSLDRDCGIDELEYLPIDPTRIAITRPNEDRRVSVNGIVTPDTLVEVVNRRLNGVGYSSPQSRKLQIASDIGQFSVTNLDAQGDDELVIQTRDLLGFKSPPVSFKVPDAELAGVDVLGAFAWEPLTNGQRGPVAVHISPYGIDGRGICPDTDQPPEVCHSGGLTHDMVSFLRAEMKVGQDTAQLNPGPSPISTARPHNRGAEGDVRSPAQDIVLVLDVSQPANAKDGNDLAPPRRFDAAARFIRGLRSRDRVGVVAFDQTARRIGVTKPDLDPGLRELERREELAQGVLGLASQSGLLNDPDILAGIDEAARMLRQAKSRNGRIVVVASNPPLGTRDEALQAWDVTLAYVQGDTDRNDPVYPVDVVGLEIASDAPNLDLIDDLNRFTDGRYYSTTAFGIEQTLTDARSYLSGSFILLYDMDIPLGVGKSGTIELELEVVLGEERARTSYTGPIRILNSSNN
ncbi:MAG: hypothetical protein KC933_22535 [Myxococcales bacterium]|nr:hypothetical protein [Myxococcales bacterium]